LPGWLSLGRGATKPFPYGVGIMIRSMAFCVGLAFVVACGAVRAAEVKITGVHVCCGACVKAVNATLKDVAGVSNSKADQDGTVSFDAADEKAAAAGIAALAKAGFHGNAKSGDKALEFPAVAVEKGAKADVVTIAGLHLCCGNCYKATGDALKGLGTVTSNKEAKTVTVTGKGIDVAAVVAALNKAGFHGTVAK
jgi:copper chaperone CopZ